MSKDIHEHQHKHTHAHCLSLSHSFTHSQCLARYTQSAKIYVHRRYSSHSQFDILLNDFEWKRVRSVIWIHMLSMSSRAFWEYWIVLFAENWNGQKFHSEYEWRISTKSFDWISTRYDRTKMPKSILIRSLSSMVHTDNRFIWMASTIHAKWERVRSVNATPPTTTLTHTASLDECATRQMSLEMSNALGLFQFLIIISTIIDQI